MKYIMIKKDGLTAPIIFPKFLNHSDVAQSLGGKVLSAGMVNLYEDGQLSAYGESISLKVKSNPEDTEFIKRQLSPY